MAEQRKHRDWDRNKKASLSHRTQGKLRIQRLSPQTPTVRPISEQVLLTHSTSSEVTGRDHYTFERGLQQVGEIKTGK